MDADSYQNVVTTVEQLLTQQPTDGAIFLQTLPPSDQERLIRTTIPSSPHRPEGPYNDTPFPSTGDAQFVSFTSCASHLLRQLDPGVFRCYILITDDYLHASTLDSQCLWYASTPMDRGPPGG